MALGPADQDDCFALGLETQIDRLRHVLDQADATDRRSRQDALAVGLVVERDVAGHDRIIERQTGFAHALDAADELAP
ncbi:MAG: hypothetical protein WDN69_32005 [Aliidongia sp.]